MPLHVSSTAVLIIRRSKLYYTASGIVTPAGGQLTGTSYLKGRQRISTVKRKTWVRKVNTSARK